MNTNGLAKHYGALSAPERFSLMLAAATRGDEIERARLTDAAPRVTFRVPHTFGRALALLSVFSHHRMEHLELAALFFKTTGLADAATGKLETQCRDAARLYGYLVNIYALGWARFCEVEQVDPTVCEEVAPGRATLDQAVREAAEIGFTEDEARAFTHRGSRDAPAALKTAETIGLELRGFYRFCRTQWE